MRSLLRQLAATDRHYREIRPSINEEVLTQDDVLCGASSVCISLQASFAGSHYPECGWTIIIYSCWGELGLGAESYLIFQLENNSKGNAQPEAGVETGRLFIREGLHAFIISITYNYTNEVSSK